MICLLCVFTVQNSWSLEHKEAEKARNWGWSSCISKSLPTQSTSNGCERNSALQHQSANQTGPHRSMGPLLWLREPSFLYKRNESHLTKNDISVPTRTLWSMRVDLECSDHMTEKRQGTGPTAHGKALPLLYVVNKLPSVKRQGTKSLFGGFCITLQSFQSQDSMTS